MRDGSPSTCVRCADTRRLARVPVVLINKQHRELRSRVLLVSKQRNRESRWAQSWPTPDLQPGRCRRRLESRLRRRKTLGFRDRDEERRERVGIQILTSHFPYIT